MLPYDLAVEMGLNKDEAIMLAEIFEYKLNECGNDFIDWFIEDMVCLN